MRRFLLAIAIAGLVLQPARAQSGCPSKNSDEAVAAVRHESQAEFPLRAIWVPNLGDNLIFLKTEGEFSPHAEVPLISFYRVVASPYELRGNKIERQTVEVDNYSEWLVAINQENGQRFMLHGSKNPIGDFNKLMQSLHLRVADADAAIAIFDFFLKTVYGEQIRSHVVGDDMKLQSVALEDFRLRFPTGKRRAAFNAWWNRLPGTARVAIKPPHARPTEGGFAVRYVLYDQGFLRRETLEVNADGTVAEPPRNERVAHSMGPGEEAQREP